MKRVFITLVGFLLLTLASISVVAVQTQVQSVGNCAANDVSCAFPLATTPGNCVIINAWVAGTDTITVGGTTMSFSGASNNGTRTTVFLTQSNHYTFYAVADGDNSYTLTSSGAGVVAAVMGEYTETTCVPEAVGFSEEDSASTPQLNITTITPAAVISVIIRTAANRSFSPSAGWNEYQGVASSTLEGFWQVFSSAGAKNLTVTLGGGSSDAAFIGAAFPSSAGAPPPVTLPADSLLLLGVGK